MNYRELRRQGRASLSHKWWLAVGVTIIYLILAVGSNLGIQFSWNEVTGDFYPGLFFPSSIIMLFLMGALMLGYMNLFLRIARGEESRFEDFVRFFRSGRLYWKSVCYYILVTVYILGWTLLLIIPGIIKSFSYAMTPYILNDNPELTVNEAITKSREMMNGYKGNLFILSLTFIGWMLLGIITFLVGFLWIQPYVETTTAHFYLKIKDNPIVKKESEPI